MEGNIKIYSSRGSNWEVDEDEDLLDFVSEYSDVINGRTSLTNTKKDKELAWHQVTNKFNSESRRGLSRIPSELERRYKRLRANAKI
jgi:hypothetical protein